MYEYKVIPFIGQVKGEKFTWENAKDVATQLSNLIEKETKGDWEFYRVDRVAIQVKPGCMAALLGAKATFIDFDQVIFRKEKT